MRDAHADAAARVRLRDGHGDVVTPVLLDPRTGADGPLIQSQSCHRKLPNSATESVIALIALDGADPLDTVLVAQ